MSSIASFISSKFASPTKVPSVVHESTELLLPPGGLLLLLAGKLNTSARRCSGAELVMLAGFGDRAGGFVMSIGEWLLPLLDDNLLSKVAAKYCCGSQLFLFASAMSS